MRGALENLIDAETFGIAIASFSNQTATSIHKGDEYLRTLAAVCKQARATSTTCTLTRTHPLSSMEHGAQWANTHAHACTHAHTDDMHWPDK